MKELPRGLSPGPTCVPEARALSARLARLSLPYLSSDRAKSRRSPSTSVESFLTVRALGFPREFGFGVRRRGVVVSGLGTVRISVGTHLSSGNYSCFPAEGCQLSPFSPRSGRCSSSRMVWLSDAGTGACSASWCCGWRVRPDCPKSADYITATSAAQRNRSGRPKRRSPRSRPGIGQAKRTSALERSTEKEGQTPGRRP